MAVSTGRGNGVLWPSRRVHLDCARACAMRGLEQRAPCATRAGLLDGMLVVLIRRGGAQVAPRLMNLLLGLSRASGVATMQQRLRRGPHTPPRRLAASAQKLSLDRSPARPRRSALGAARTHRACRLSLLLEVACGTRPPGVRPRSRRGPSGKRVVSYRKLGAWEARRARDGSAFSGGRRPWPAGARTGRSLLMTAAGPWRRAPPS